MFRDYMTTPMRTPAHQITNDDHIKSRADSINGYRITNSFGDDIPFTAYSPIQAGDYIVKDNDHTYHVTKKQFFNTHLCTENGAPAKWR